MPAPSTAKASINSPIVITGGIVKKVWCFIPGLAKDSTSLNLGTESAIAFENKYYTTCSQVMSLLADLRRSPEKYIEL